MLTVPSNVQQYTEIKTNRKYKEPIQKDMPFETKIVIFVIVFFCKRTHTPPEHMSSPGHVHPGRIQDKSCITDIMYTVFLDI